MPKIKTTDQIRADKIIKTLRGHAEGHHSELADAWGISQPAVGKRLKSGNITLFDPSVLSINAQMRAGSGNTKFMGQVENWRKLLKESKVLENAYNSGKHRGMISLSPKDANGKNNKQLRRR